ncbi:hypothetical protein DEJ28_06920 [Curtobacterium sp. MCPF17_002]|nr:hypothetical protein [Curtobacterium sp. MCPF17_002]WIB78823.1 hypothetical protein DEJ28_06920 [Curtobacterium sp. MCPF17_002]
MRVISVFGRGIGFVLTVVAKVIGTWNGAKPAGDDAAVRLNNPRREDYRP